MGVISPILEVAKPFRHVRTTEPGEAARKHSADTYLKLVLLVISSIAIVSILATTAMRRPAAIVHVQNTRNSPGHPVKQGERPFKPTRRPLSFYTANGQVNWSQPIEPEPLPVLIYGPVYVPPVPPPIPPDPLAEYVYSGYSIVGDEPSALLEDRRDQQGAWHKVGETFQGFTIDKIAPGAITLAQGPIRRDLAFSDTINVIQLEAQASSGVTGQPDPGNVTKFRGQNNQSFFFEVTGRLSGPVYGTGLYTDDSDVGSAAVHAGILQNGQKGTVKVTILPGASHYDGSLSNGVSSSSYESWTGSYRIERVARRSAPPGSAAGPQNSPGALRRKGG